jgi:hypothetical protein
LRNQIDVLRISAIFDREVLAFNETEFDRLASAIAADLGGVSELSAIERALVEAFAGSAVLLQSLNTKLAAGEAINFADHALSVSSLVRIAAKIGLSRRSRVVAGIVEADAEPLPWSPLRHRLEEQRAREAANSVTSDEVPA